MTLRTTPLPGVHVVEGEPNRDSRGWFMRVWCADELHSHGLAHHLSQCSLSFNATAGTLRGMHFQAAPFAENKLVRCLAGAIYDVALDLRPESPTYLRYFAVELSSANHRALYIPAGCAHGFQALVDSSMVAYWIDAPFRASSARRVRYDDPAFAISWPRPVTTISPADENCPDFQT